MLNAIEKNKVWKEIGPVCRILNKEVRSWESNIEHWWEGSEMWECTCWVQGAAGSPRVCSMGNRGEENGIGVQAQWWHGAWMANPRTAFFWDGNQVMEVVFVCFYFNQIFYFTKNVLIFLKEYLWSFLTSSNYKTLPLIQSLTPMLSLPLSFLHAYLHIWEFWAEMGWDCFLHFKRITLSCHLIFPPCYDMGDIIPDEVDFYFYIRKVPGK